MAKKGFNPCTDDEKRRMIEAYQSGLSARKAAALVGRSDPACFGALREAGIQPRTLSVSHQKYKANYHFFDLIDSEEKAYWLGFVMADSTMQRNDISIRLAEKDLNHIEKFKRTLKSDHPIHPYQAKVKGKSYPYRRLVICSEYMRKTLNRYGFIKKCECLGAPTEFFDEKLHHHYWRGVCDGDGSFCLSKKGNWSFEITSHPALIDDLHTFLLQQMFTRAAIEREGTYSRFRVSGNIVTKAVAIALYREATVFMDRKKELAEQVMTRAVHRFNKNLELVLSAPPEGAGLA
jgi:hypothetical protein